MAADNDYYRGWRPADVSTQGFREDWIDSMRGSVLGRSDVGQQVIGMVDSYLHVPDNLIGGIKSIPVLAEHTYNSVQQHGVGRTLLNGWVGTLQSAGSGFFQVAYGNNGEARGRAEFAFGTMFGGGEFAAEGKVLEGVADTANAAEIGTGASNDERMIQVFRGTKYSAENDIYTETGHLLSDAGRMSYRQTGSLEEAYS